MGKNKFLLVIVVLLSCVFLMSCKKEIKFTMGNLTDEIKKEIKESYLERYEIEGTYEDIWLMRYYGKFDNSYAVILSDKYIEEIPEERVTEKVAGMPIVYLFKDAYIHIYNKGKLYRLQEAYDKGLIDEECVIKIMILHGYKSPNYEEYNGW